MPNWATNRMKEDEKIEKRIRGLLKLPENRRCINCNCLGPQYVCTTFLTFVCTNCSGVHREFTHRVKSVSMAKFNAEEVSALQAGGNERARQIYFKEWDPQRHSFPDGSNLHRLRDFIKHVYVDRKYSGDKSTDKLPRLRLSDRRESYENKVGVDTFQRHHIERISPGGRSEDKGFRYVYDERRSPRYAQENSRYGGYRRSLARFEVVDDRFRDEGVESDRRTHIRRFSGGEFKLGSRSPHSEKNMDRSMSPVVHPVRDILGENVPPLQVGNLPKVNDSKDAGGSAHNQRIVSSSSTVSIDEEGLQIVNSGSLIDLGTDPEPSNAAAVPQTQQMPPSIDGGNGASFISSVKSKSPHAPNANTLESLLFELSVPPVEPACNTAEVPSSGDAPSTAPLSNLLMLPSGDVSPPAPLGSMSALPNSESAASTKSTTNVLGLPPNGDALAATPFEMAPELPNSCGDSTGEVTDGQHLRSMHQYQPSAFPVADGSFAAQQITPPVGALNNQSYSSSFASNAQTPSSASAEQLFQAVSKPAQDASSGAGSQPLPVEAKSGGRKELPADLFTASYSSATAPVPAWQTGPSHGVGYGMQYYPTAVVPAFPNSARSTNPFDLNNETIQAPMFPSMAPLQDALPNVSASTGLLRASSIDTQYPQLMSQSPSYSSAMSQSSYAGQEVHNKVPPSRIQDFGSLGAGGANFSSLNTNQQLASMYSAPITPNSFSSVGGNPFG